MGSTISSIFFVTDYWSFMVAVAATLFCFLFATALVFRKPKLEGSPSELNSLKPRDCACLGEDSGVDSGEEMTARLSGGGKENGVEMAVDRQTGASMMEQLVPEITTHALSYLDYPSLCRLSMTNSLMRKAANDDNAWKALYHKELNTTLNPLSSYNAVMESWQLAFSWENVADFQIRDVRTRVLTDMAWVTMKVFVDIGAGPFNVTNIFEFHNGRWYMVHHHSSALLIHRGGQQQLMQA
ncbi:F-box protein SKIP8 [Sesamum angolense]|uniref:F-box protein SKIP8 n=1 Tax=Sesamum angolense TaxID=2727404 RepID=A0AAE1VZC5_9LAMI|nr:F-box protein SKIP8 [Sesamum angolense]